MYFWPQAKCYRRIGSRGTTFGDCFVSSNDQIKMPELGKFSFTLAALLSLSIQECRCCGLTDALESNEGPRNQQNVVHWFKLQFDKDAVTAELRQLANESNLGPSDLEFKYRNFGQQEIPIQQKHRPNMLAKLGDAIKKTLAPIADYMAIAGRYRDWLKQYKQLEGRVAHRHELKPPIEVLREEYAKADELLKRQVEECATEDEVDTETVDFIFNVLTKLIDRLEWRLDTEKRNLGFPMGGSHQSKEITNLPDDEGRVQNAMQRVKQVAVNSVMKQVITESLRVARIATFNMMARSMADSYNPDNEIRFYISKIIAVLGSANTSLVVSYLRDIQFRAALAAVRHVNQSPVFECLQRKEKDGEE